MNGEFSKIIVGVGAIEAARNHRAKQAEGKIDLWRMQIEDEKMYLREFEEKLPVAAKEGFSWEWDSSYLTLSLVGPEFESIEVRGLKFRGRVTVGSKGERKWTGGVVGPDGELLEGDFKNAHCYVSGTDGDNVCLGNHSQRFDSLIFDRELEAALTLVMNVLSNVPEDDDKVVNPMYFPNYFRMAVKCKCGWVYSAERKGKCTNCGARDAVGIFEPTVKLSPIPPVSAPPILRSQMMATGNAGATAPIRPNEPAVEAGHWRCEGCGDGFVLMDGDGIGDEQYEKYGVTVCERCHDYGWRCSGCSNIEWDGDEQRTGPGDSTICESCTEDTSSCAECDTIIWNDDSRYSERLEATFCGNDCLVSYCD